jgi:hypothetical protein
MLYIVGTEVSTQAITPRQAQFGVNKTLGPRKNSIFPTGKRWILGRIHKDQETEKIVYLFYNANNDPKDIINLEFDSCEAADQAIARARGEQIVPDGEKGKLSKSAVDAKYDIVNQHMARNSQRPDRMGNINSPQTPYPGKSGQ